MKNKTNSTVIPEGSFCATIEEINKQSGAGPVDAGSSGIKYSGDVADTAGRHQPLTKEMNKQGITMDTNIIAEDFLTRNNAKLNKVVERTVELEKKQEESYREFVDEIGRANSEGAQ